jgi:hypothetical protein
MFLAGGVGLSKQDKPENEVINEDSIKNASVVAQDITSTQTL